MAINWNGVEALLDAAAIEARKAETIDEAMHSYNAKVIEALQMMISTALVNGGITTTNGPITGGLIS